MNTTDTVRFGVHLDPDLHRALRLKPAQSRRGLSDIVGQALRLSLREDQADLAAVRARAGEKRLDYETFLARLSQQVRRGC